jgi:hypothetical protein
MDWAVVLAGGSGPERNDRLGVMEQAGRSTVLPASKGVLGLIPMVSYV